MKREEKQGPRDSIKKILTFILIISLSVLFIFNTTGCKKDLKDELPAGPTDLDAATTNELPSQSNEITEDSSTIPEDKNTRDSIEELIINIGSLKGPTSIGMIKLHKENPSLGDGVTTNYEIVASPDIMISKILSGEIDMAALPTNVAIKLYNKGFDIKLAAVIGYGVLYILYQNIEITGWEDVMNKKIQVISKGSTPDVMLRYLLAENSIDAVKDVELDYSIEQTELSQLMIAGKTDIAILPEPFVTLVLEKNSNVKIGFDIEAEWKKVKNGTALPMSCLVVNSELAEENRDIVDFFLSKYKESIDWVNKNPGDAANLVEEFDIGMSGQTAIDAIPRCNIRFTSADEALESVNTYIKTILDFSPEDVGGKMPDENFYY